MAQLAEQLICNQQVIGSSPIIGFWHMPYGWFPEWPKGADCKSVVYDFDGSNPSPSIFFIAGWSSLEARRAHNPKVVGSNPTPATNFYYFSRASALFYFQKRKAYIVFLYIQNVHKPSIFRGFYVHFLQ